MLITNIIVKGNSLFTPTTEELMKKLKRGLRHALSVSSRSNKF